MTSSFLLRFITLLWVDLQCVSVVFPDHTHFFMVLSGAVLKNSYAADILNKSENATLQLSIFYKKVLDKKYLLKNNNVAQTSSKRFVETSPICLV